MSQTQFVVQFDPTPRPVASYVELWGRELKTLNAWCVKGWIPGAFKHPSGEWWVRPLDMLNWSPDDALDADPPEPKVTAKRGNRAERLRYES